MYFWSRHNCVKPFMDSHYTFSNPHSHFFFQFVFSSHYSNLCSHHRTPHYNSPHILVHYTHIILVYTNCNLCSHYDTLHSHFKPNTHTMALYANIIIVSTRITVVFHSHYGAQYSHNGLHPQLCLHSQYGTLYSHLTLNSYCNSLHSHYSSLLKL